MNQSQEFFNRCQPYKAIIRNEKDNKRTIIFEDAEGYVLDNVSGLLPYQAGRLALSSQAKAIKRIYL